MILRYLDPLGLEPSGETSFPHSSMPSPMCSYVSLYIPTDHIILIDIFIWVVVKIMVPF